MHGLGCAFLYIEFARTSFMIGSSVAEQSAETEHAKTYCTKCQPHAQISVSHAITRMHKQSRLTTHNANVHSANYSYLCRRLSNALSVYRFTQFHSSGKYNSIQMAIDAMHILNRSLKVIITPRAVWRDIKNENNDINDLISSFVIPVVGIVASIAFIAGIASKDFTTGLAMGISIFAADLISVIIASYVLLELPKNFDGHTDLGTASAIVIYASVPAWILTAVSTMHPNLSELHWIGFYSYIIFYFGLSALIEIPEEKRTGFNIIASLLLLLVNSLVGVAGNKILYAIL